MKLMKFFVLIRFIQNPKHTSYGIIRFIYSTLFMLLFITPFPWIYLLLKECDFTNFKSMISFRVIWGNIHSKHFSFNYIYFHYDFLDKVYMTDLEYLEPKQNKLNHYRNNLPNYNQIKNDK